MRNRILRHEYFTDHRLMVMEPAARLLYMSLQCQADSAGRLALNYTCIKNWALPGDEIDIRPLLIKLEAVGLIATYSKNSLGYLQLTEWSKQGSTAGEPASINPAYSERDSEASPLEQLPHPKVMNLPAELQENPRRISEKIRKKIYKQGVLAYSRNFLKFWSAFPFKKGTRKKDTFAHWEKLRAKNKLPHTEVLMSELIGLEFNISPVKFLNLVSSKFFKKKTPGKNICPACLDEGFIYGIDSTGRKGRVPCSCQRGREESDKLFDQQSTSTISGGDITENF